MTRSAPQRLARSLAFLAAALPFAFALFSAFGRRHDLRSLWLALATFAGASLVRLVIRRRENGIGAAIGTAIAAFIVATIFGAEAVRLMMSGLPVGALAVAVGFSLCFAFSYALVTLSAAFGGNDDALAGSQRQR